MRLKGSRGKKYTLEDRPFACGGEATIWSVHGRSGLVAKLYKKPTGEREAKLAAMLAAPPEQPSSHMAIAWPQELLYRKDGWFQPQAFVGFVMPRIAGGDKLFNFYNPLRRRQRYPGCNWRHLHRIAYNLAVAVDAVHGKGHLVGDLNEGNILVDPKTALVTLVDSDSFQIRRGDGVTYPCIVGKAEFTAPELQGAHLADTLRKDVHDRFGLAVLIFQLLMQGCSPFAGVLAGNTPIERIDLYCLRHGLFPFLNNRADLKPPPAAPPLSLLAPEVKDAFIECFCHGYRDPARRLSSRDWQHVLSHAEQSLVQCRQDSNHYYAQQLASCPWCSRQPRQPGQKAGRRSSA